MASMLSRGAVLAECLIKSSTPRVSMQSDIVGIINSVAFKGHRDEHKHSRRKQKITVSSLT